MPSSTWHGASWLGAEGKSLLACRDHLLAGCWSFSIFTFLAWLCAVLNGHHRKATLSEMVNDWDTAEGKIFIAALLLPAIFFLVSGYPYFLENARVDGHPLGHVFIIVRHFLVTTGLIIVAFVPTLPNTETRAHTVEIWLHSIAATTAFVSFSVSELFVLACHSGLEDLELRWRARAWGLQVACLLLLVVHKTMYQSGLAPDYSAAWTFRYEMLVGSGVISQNQLIWHFSDPDPTQLKERGFKILAVIPYLGVLLVVGCDFAYRKNLYALPWGALEALALAVLTMLSVFFLHSLHSRFGATEQVALDTQQGESSYGTA